jgi:Fe-S cluster assembly protein SufD
LGGSVRAQAVRHAAFDRFAAAALPSAELEEWRYSRIDALELDRYHPATDVDAAARVARATSTLSLLDGIDASTVVTVTNGRVTGIDQSEPAVTVTATDGDLVAAEAIAGEPDALVMLNTALSAPLVIEVAAGARVSSPIVIVHELAGDGVASFPRTLVKVGANAEVTLVEVSISPDIDALVVPVTELDVAEGANVAYVHLQQLGRRVWQIGLQGSRVGRDATLTSASVALGGDYARMRTTSALVGTGGTARLLAVYFGSGDRMVDFRTTQDHRAPKTTSELLFKGAVANRSGAVYSGLIRVEKGARGTNAFQTNRNLVLHEGAHAKSVPNLEIEDNDVRCSHASAVGPVSEDQRFYLESRGVPPDVADRLITLGFLDEVLERLPVPAVAEYARVRLASILDEAERAEAAALTTSDPGTR